MIERIRSDGSGRPPERSPRRRAIVAAVTAATIALSAAFLLAPRDAAPAARSAPQRILTSAFSGPKTHERSVSNSEEVLGAFPPYRIVIPASDEVGSAMCGRVDGGLVEPMDCRADGVNVYVFETAPAGAHRFGSCTDRTELVTRQGDRLLCWRLLVVR
jgi:hypothetical protein